MQKFEGFKSGKFRHIKVPAPFFSELLPLIDDLAELKVTLFCLWAFSQKDSRFRYLRQRDFEAERPSFLTVSFSSRKIVTLACPSIRVIGVITIVLFSFLPFFSLAIF